MKILFLSQIVPFPPHGGVLQRGYNLLRELARNHEVHLMAFVHPDILATAEAVEESRVALEAFCSRVEFFELWPKRSRFHLYAGLTLSSLLPVPFSVVAHRSVSFGRRIKEIESQRGAQVVHFDTIGLAQYAGRAAALPRVLAHHNIESHLMARRAAVEANPLKRAYLRMQTERLHEYEVRQSPKFNANVTVSDVDAKRLEEMVPGVRTCTVPNGVDLEYFSPQPDPGSAELVWTGGMNMFANRDAVEFFLSWIWPLVLDRRPDAKFTIVGQDPSPQVLQAGARDSRVSVCGFVPDIRPHVARAAVYVVPIRVGGGTRLKVLDAMAMGKAIVSTRVGCEGISATPGTDLVTADEPEAFASSICDLLDSADRRRALGEAARSLVASHYSWSSLAADLAALYEEVSAEPSVGDRSYGVAGRNLL